MEIKDQPEDVNLGQPSYPSAQPTTKSSMPLIAGILLLIAGIIGLIFWIQILTVDWSSLGSLIDINQFNQYDPSLTLDQIIGFITTCAIVGVILSIFPILGGILAVKRKLWGISLACSIIGLFTLGIMFSSSGLSFIAMIILIFARKEF